MVKSVRQKVDDIVTGESNKQGLEIFFTFDHAEDVAEEMRAQGKEVPDRFRGPKFMDIMGYQIGNEWVLVSLKDGTSYVYPSKLVTRIKHFNYTE